MERVGIGGVLIMEVDQGTRKARSHSPLPNGATCLATHPPRQSSVASRCG
jgi:hypothetical protein